MDQFVHLHVHSQYSLLDGANRIGDLVATAKQFGMPALALTDHGNLFGAVDFHDAAAGAGVKPILGMEAYISPTTRADKSMRNPNTASYHLILLAMDETGWRNLMKLSSRAYLEGFYYRPRIDRELLGEYNEGLICTTACLSGELPAALLAEKPDRARRIAGEYLDIFGRERLFIEVQKQGLAEQDRVNGPLASLAEELGVGIVGTNDVHFLRREDKRAHEVLTCISTGKALGDEARLAYPPELYFKDAAQMRSLLRPWPAAADNTLKIAEMCNVKLDVSAKHLPVFQPPDGRTPEQYLRDLAWEGLARRFGADGIPAAYRERLEWELKVLTDKGYASYFLIVNDFVQYARRNDIPAAPRGSGVATLLGYALGIADVDPLRYGLLFERFTDPARQEDPDMDIDICQEGRAKVIQYVREKYGHVAQIITYGTLKARAAIRDVGRTMNIPLPDVDRIAKLVPEGPKVTLKSALDTEPELGRLYDADAQARELLDYALRLEGLARHCGVHAAGVIVAQEPLENIVPLCRQGDGDDVITQWDGETCENKIGLMKMDFLGLRTLTILQRARELVRRLTGKDIDPENLPLDDPKVYELFRRGQTDGIFQFESEGMKGVLVQMQPERIEDLIAANAMYRPGPMGLIPTYCARKNRLEDIPSVHELVDDLLAETYGVMAYQEQVMQVMNRLGKIPLNRALSGIKAISKKKRQPLLAQRPDFLAGARDNGIAEEDAQRLFDLIVEFAGYGFNKAHSTRYAIVAYQAAYFKVHHPREFLAATLTFECSDTDKVVQYMAEAERMGVRIGPPDINACGADFAVDGDRVRFGLAAVKGVGAKAVEAILAARKNVGRFTELYHFCGNVDLHAVNRATIEALIKCGAFDALGANRAAMAAALDDAIQIGQGAAADRRSGQLSLMDIFAGTDAPKPPAQFPDVEPWSESQLLAAEKETLGFYVTSHPLVRYARELDSLSSPRGAALGQIQSVPGGTPVTIGCMIVSVRKTVTKKTSRRMAILTLEDVTGKCDAVVFPDAYERLAELLKPEKMVFVTGTIDRQRDRPSILVDDATPIDEALEKLTGFIRLRLPAAGAPDDFLDRLRGILGRHRGRCPLLLEFRPTGRRDLVATVQAGGDWAVQPSRALMNDLADLFEEEDVLLRPKPRDGNNGVNGRRSYRRSRGGNGS